MAFVVMLILVLSLVATPAVVSAQTAVTPNAPAEVPAIVWQYGGFVDIGYLGDFNHPSNHVFRGRGTAWHVDEWDVNMTAVYLKKKALDQSRWGTEVLVQGGKDAEVFGFSASAPNIAGADWLRYVGLANVSYLAPAGKGLALQAGVF